TDSFAAGVGAQALHDGSFVWADDSSFPERFSSTADNQFLIRAAGGVGIGTSTPARMLEVVGDVRANGYDCGTGVSGTYSGHLFNFDWGRNTTLNAYIDGVKVWSLVTTSDRRLKEDIQPMADTALERVMALKPASFKYRNIAGTVFTSDGRTMEGFIADELQQVIPSAVNGEKDAVTSEGKIQPQTLNIIPVVSVLTKAVQEQQRQLNAKDAEIQSLKRQNDSLANRLSNVEKMVQSLARMN
ncbi:MAG: tail fiber domain-containing protein, partial [Limisphaerales bacterium]